MTKPVIVKRSTKGSHLTFTELDNNFQNLDDATISIAVSGDGTVVNDLNGTTTLVPSDEIFLTADNTAKTVTVSEKIIRLYAYVHNSQGAIISKGQPVYLYQATGDKPSVKLALNTSDATSAKVLGLAAETLAIGADGYVITQGKLVGVDTSAFSEGDTLYLGSTAGTLTATKPYAPNHLVYMGVVAKANAGQGEIYVRAQNGYELEELHNVNIDHNVSLANKDYLVYNSSNSLWENRSLDTVNDTSPQLGGDLDINGHKIVSTSNGNIELDPDGTGKVIISGDLQVDGTTTTINSTTLDVDDKNITLAKGAANGAAADGGGITVEGPTTSATLLYANSDDSWNLNKKTTAPELQIDNVNINGNTISTTDTNGSLTLTPNGTGDLVLDGVKWPQADGTSNQYLRTNGSGQLTWATPAGGITDVVNDTSPQLGGDLDVNGHIITSTSNTAVNIMPNGTGAVYLASNSNKVTLTVGSNTGTRISSLVTDSTNSITFQHDKAQWQIFDEASHGIVFQGATGGNSFSITSKNVTVSVDSGGFIQLGANKYPTTTGSANYFLKTDGAGNLSWSSVSTGAISNVVEDTTPQLGGDLDVNGFKLTSTTNGDIVLDPNGTGYVRSKAQYLLVGETGATSSFIYTQDSTANDIAFGHSNGASVTAYKSGLGSGIDVFAAAGEDVFLSGTRVRASRLNTAGVITTNGTGSLTLQTNNAGTSSGKIIIAEGANGNISVTPNGTGKSILANINYNETIYDLGTTGGTIAPNVTNGNIQKITLNSALTLNAFTSPVAGQSLTLMIFGGTAYTSITSTMKFSGGIKTLTGTAGCVDILSVFYDGTNYYASLGKGFA